MVEVTNNKNRVYPMKTELLSEMITDRARKIAAINQDEKFVVSKVEGDDTVTTMEGTVENV